MKEVSVSIIVPVYNVEKYVRECVMSLINQTLCDIEIIIVNDGSTDRSGEIIAEMAKNDLRIRVISKENTGYGSTMNIGIKAASGKYIGILEADDTASADMYERLFAMANKTGADVVKSDFYRFETVNGKVAKTYVPLTNDLSWYGRAINPKREPNALRLKMNTWTGVYRRDFLTANNIVHNETAGASYQDNGFFFQTMCLAEKVVFVNRAYYLNRRDNPSSSVYDKGKVYAMCNEMAFVKAFLKSKPDLWEIFKDVYYYKLLSNYEFTYNRIADERKEEFLSRMSEEFSEAEKSGEMSIRKSFSEAEMARVRIIIDKPSNYPTYGLALELQGRIDALESELGALKASKSYRLGRLITGCPRYLRDALKRIRGVS